MKTTKLVFVITLVAFATMIFAQADKTNQVKPVPFQKCIKITLKKAMHDRGLVEAIQQQTSPKMLEPHDSIIYTARVYYRHTVYFVTATRNEWLKFFNTDFIEDPER